MRIDLHTHSNISDGTDSPQELITAAAAAGLDVIGLADHDTFDGIEIAREQADIEGIELVAGIEISAQYQGTSVHLLGYGCDQEDAPLLAELARIREARDNRVPRICEKLTELGLPLTVSQVQAQARNATSLGRPHVADAMIAAGYVADRQEAFDRYLQGPARVRRYQVELTQGIELIHQAGGAAVIAHPWGRSAKEVLSAAALAALVAETGLEGIEIEHQDHDELARRQLRRLAIELGLIATGASDYHGRGKKNHELGCNLTSPEAYRELQQRMTARAEARKAWRR